MGAPPGKGLRCFPEKNLLLLAMSSALCTPLNYIQEELVLEPGQGIRHYWRDLWAYRELLYILAWRDVVVRYKQTIIGVAWAIIRPVLSMVMFTVIFSKVAKLPSEAGVPYPILVYLARLPWRLFASTLA